MDPQLQPDLSLKATTEGTGQPGLKLVFRGSLKHLLGGSGGRLPGGSWRQDGGSEQQEVAALSPGGGAALSDSPGRPFSPSSAEASPKVVAAARGESVLPAMKGLRSVHIQPPGKHPYPDDQTPEAESVRAQLQPQQPRAGAREGRADGPYAGTGAELEAANPRSVLAQPPGKQPHPDDPAFGQQQEEEQQQQEQREGQASQHAQLHMGHLGGADAEATRPKSVHRQPPGKQPDQIQQIAASAQEVEDLGPQLLRSHAATVKPLAPWRLQQPGPQQVGSQLNVPAPAGSSQQARVLAPPLAPGGSAGMTDNASSRKRPAGHSGEAGQRKKANGAAEGGSASAGPQRQSFAGTPSLVVPSLARPGEALQQIRPMPGAPRSLQQRQQLANGALAGSVGRKSVGASRPKQSGGSSGAAKPKQASTKPGTSGQRKSGGTAGSTAAGAGLPGIPAGSPQFRPGDVVWAKIGNYPWWPAQLQRPSTEDHIKPKHSSSDLFCVFYGSNDYNWLPASALKPFTEIHPDYSKHANVKNKALQRAVDEAWVYGMQRPRPDWKAAP